MLSGLAGQARGAHPRMRGENGIRSSRLLRARGSSPHARGKPARAKAAEAMRGSSPHARGKLLKAGGASMIGWLIPACAGKTLKACITSTQNGAHPRMRGENSILRSVSEGLPGSSPHARGKPRFASAVPWIRRLIPACAGKTILGGTMTAPLMAHPRMRGENSCQRC